jgi:hypothetical protein
MHDYTIIWNEKGCFKIQTFWMQGISSSEVLNKERIEKKKHTPQAVESIYLGFASDCK